MKRLKIDLAKLYGEISHERLKRTKMRNKRHKSEKDYDRKRTRKPIDFEQEE